VSRLGRHRQHRRFTRAYATDEDRMLAMITGFAEDELGPGMLGLGTRLRRFLPWLRASNTLPCRFEDLVGERGGGSQATQVRALREIGGHLRRPLTEEMATEIARRTWSSTTATFRGGARGEWRTHFDQRLRQAFEREVGVELLAEYGYEAD
jgi:hypothetical protein